MAVDLYINERQVDLAEDTVVALTFQINDLAELKDRQANYSNQFKLPKSDNNAAIFENADFIQSQTNIPYSRLAARLIIDGIEIISNGYVVFNATDTNYNITIYSGLTDFFDLVGERNIADVDINNLNHDWNLANILAQRGNVTTFKYPIVDHGVLVNTNRVVNGKYLLPAVFVKYLVGKIVTDAGYTLFGNIINTVDYSSLLLPIQTIANKKDFTCRSERSTDYTMLNSNGAISAIQFNNEIKDDYNVLNNENTPTNFAGEKKGTIFTAYSDGTYTFQARIKYSLSYNNGTHSLEFIKWRPGFSSTVISYSSFAFIQTGDRTITTAPVILLKGEKVGVFIGVRTGENSTIKKGSFFACINSDVPKIAFGEEFKMNDYLPSISQKNFIKAIANIFGIIFQINARTKKIYFRQFNEIIEAIPQARDWSKKLDESNRRIEYKIGNYGQKNNVRYSDDGNDKDIEAGNGDGFFNVNDANLPKEVEAFTLPFAATAMKKALEDLDVPLLRLVEGGEIKKTAKPRLLIDDTQDITGTPISLTDGTTTINISTDIPLCYFKKSGKAFNLDFQSLLNDNYKGIVGVLNKTKKMTLLFNLLPIDVYEFDHFIPVYLKQYSAYFYVNKIINFTGRGLTKVELVRL